MHEKNKISQNYKKLPEIFWSTAAFHTWHRGSHLCHEAMNCCLPCGLNTVDIVYFDKFETTDSDSAPDSAPDNLLCFHFLS